MLINRTARIWKAEYIRRVVVGMQLEVILALKNAILTWNECCCWHVIKTEAKGFRLNAVKSYQLDVNHGSEFESRRMMSSCHARLWSCRTCLDIENCRLGSNHVCRESKPQVLRCKMCLQREPYCRNRKLLLNKRGVWAIITFFLRKLTLLD